MSNERPHARTDRDFLIVFIGRNLRRMDADLNRMGAALQQANPASDKLPSAAFAALDAVTGRAAELSKALATIAIRHPAIPRAIAGLDSLVAGLKTLRTQWVSFGTPYAKVSPPVQRSIDHSLARARAELLATDKALGCPWGCPQPPPQPKLPKFGARP